MLACALIFSLVTFSACSSDDDNDNPVTEPVFLSKIDMVTFTPLTGDTLPYSTQNNYWEGGLFGTPPPPASALFIIILIILKL